MRIDHEQCPDPNIRKGYFSDEAFGIGIFCGAIVSTAVLTAVYWWLG